MTKRTIAHLVAGAGLVAIVTLLAGCAPTHRRTESTVSHPADPVASPPRLPPSPTPTPRPSPSYVLVTPLTFVGAFGVREPIDHGPEEYAEGTVIRDAKGGIVAYHVASGDILDFIAERFGLGRYDAYIVTINQIRRGGTDSDAMGGLYYGDVLNLSAFTMTRYGSVNDEVRHDAPPDPMPPQQ